MIHNHDELMSGARHACIELREAIEGHRERGPVTDQAVDPERAREMAWALVKTARMLVEDDGDRTEEIDRVAVLLDECEDILR